MREDQENTLDEDNPTRRLDQYDATPDKSQNTRRLASLQSDADDEEEGESYRRSRICDECGTEMFWGQAGAYVTVAQSPNRKQGIFPKGSALRVLICPYCGLTKFYTIDATKLQE